MSLFARGRETKKRNSVVITVPPLVKKSSKSRSFHFRYLELCRAKNLTPVPDIRSNPNATTFLDLLGDKLGVSEWLLIIEALHYDLVLQTLAIRMRRTNGNNIVLPIDTENRARLFRQKPVIYTRFIFNSLVDAISNCVKLNKNLTVLKLEGLPLQDGYIECIAKALASNDCLKEVSFQKSYIGDKGCEAICSTVKYLNHVEIFNISECNISSKGADYVADMIKMQKITRYSEGWEKSLRYRSVDVDSIAGLRYIAVANNPDLGDNGVRPIAEVLKEDAWVKTVDMENCGLTDCGANIILECLSLNSAITEFNVRHNPGISKFLMRQIRDHFGKEDEEKMNEPKYDLSCINGLQSLPKTQKYSISQLLAHTKTLEEQLSLERTLRKKAEKLNEKLNHQLMSMGQGASAPLIPPPPLPEKVVEATALPKGYVLVKNDYMQSFNKTSYKNGPQLVTPSGPLVNSAVTSSDSTPRSANATLRKQQKQQQQQQQQQLQHHLELSPEDLEVDVEDEEEDEDDEEQQQAYQAMADNPQLRQQLQVRKVRSEMKYVEACAKEAKKRESKSDHEFANERDFKLNPNVQFEVDIGDSCLVNEQQMERERYESREEIEYYEHQEMMQKQHSNSHYEPEYIGDGVRNDSHKNSAKIKKQYGEIGNSQMALYMAELERKINGKSAKKRHKSKQSMDSPHGREVKNSDYVHVETFMANMEQSSQDSPNNDSDSEGEKTESTTRAQSDGNGNDSGSGMSGMKVFVRRTSHYEEEQEEIIQVKDAGDQIVSPRTVYLELQRKKSEKNH
ncbi:protein Cep78 homolog isoform X2 [Drosophila navojoa]|uniref:protein Cep78 homolog isoform X2 n=1 Tax=Drosophila navojoa TaxID=7232 RepID=UPI0011BEAE0A|nr:protein Cep78 homolog isoform X2 [Drosophila navojoa]